MCCQVEYGVEWQDVDECIEGGVEWSWQDAHWVWHEIGMMYNDPHICYTVATSNC